MRDLAVSGRSQQSLMAVSGSRELPALMRNTSAACNQTGAWSGTGDRSITAPKFVDRATALYGVVGCVAEHPTSE